MKTKDTFSKISIIVASVTLLISGFSLITEFKDQLFNSGIFISMIAAIIGLTVGLLATKLISKKHRRFFLSYPSELKELAFKLEKELEQNGVNVLRAEEFLQVGDSIKDKVNKYIDKVDAVIVLINKDTKKSHFVQSEINRAIKQGKTIIPLLVEEEVKYIPKSIKNVKYELIYDNTEMIEELVNRIKTVPDIA